MIPPMCKVCTKAHWPRDGCKWSTCAGCAARDEEIDRLKRELVSMATANAPSVSKSVSIAAAKPDRREYMRNLMRRKRAAAKAQA
jgi:hypothetical protein